MVKTAVARRTARDGTYDIGVLVKALDVLQVLSRGRPVGLTEIAQETGASKPSTFRILSTLETRDFVVKDPSTRQYRPGPKLVALGSAVVSSVDLIGLSRPVLDDLAQRYGETVNLAVLHGNQIRYLTIVESRRGLRMSARAGDVDALHSTALGKALLSTLPREEAMVLIGHGPLERRTPRTIVDADKLAAELERAAGSGLAYDDQENEVGARCVAVAIRGGDERPVAAISVSGPTARLSRESLDMIGEDLRRAARQLEERMGLAVPAADGQGA